MRDVVAPPKENNMEHEFKISPKKIYDAEITSARCILRSKYNCQALQLYFYLNELDKTTTCTFDIPKTLKPTKGTFTSIVGKITNRVFDEGLLEKPSLLVKEVLKEVAGKKLKVKLALSTDGKFINVEEIVDHD